MNITQLLHTCFRSIFRNRMRSLLTSLGIIIGVGSVIIMVAIGEGSQKAIESQIASMGTNLLQIMPSRQTVRVGSQMQMRPASFTKFDIQKIREESSFVTAVSGIVQSNANVTGSMGNAQVSIQGVEPDFFTVRNWFASEGYVFDEEDMELRNRVALLGQATAASLFGTASEALGEQIRIRTDYYTVIGLLESKGAGLGGNNQDDIVILPMDTAMGRIGSRTINTIICSVAGKEYMEAAQKEVELILRESRKIADNVASDFNIMNQADMINMTQSVLQTLTTLLAAIAGVSLLVGGIGIMNIMLVSVTERTREIGIRMAVGGRKRDILFQFLTESMILSVMGGLIGVGMAALVCRLVAMIGLSTSINPLIVAIATIFAAGVGIVFGYYPALKAARLYPIDALRYE